MFHQLSMITSLIFLGLRDLHGNAILVFNPYVVQDYTKKEQTTILR